MSSWRYISQNDPDAELDYSLRADARLRVAFGAKQLSDFAASYVGLVNDDIGNGVEMLSGVADMGKLLAQLQTDVAMHVLSAGGGVEEIGYVLDTSQAAAEQRFAELWADRQAAHAAQDRIPVDPRMRHLMR